MLLIRQFKNHIFTQAAHLLLNNNIITIKEAGFAEGRKTKVSTNEETEVSGLAAVQTEAQRMTSRFHQADFHLKITPPRGMEQGRKGGVWKYDEH